MDVIYMFNKLLTLRRSDKRTRGSLAMTIRRNVITFRRFS